ncbi:MAG: hypothetical protein ACI8RZ_007348 [Myxococcota bacterium]|jgi:hypothetical protein
MPLRIWEPLGALGGAGRSFEVAVSERVLSLIFGVANEASVLQRRGWLNRAVHPWLCASTDRSTASSRS